MQEKHSERESLICTIGHSTHPLDVFISLLNTNEVTHVLDVAQCRDPEKIPSSIRQRLPEPLHAVGIEYMHLPGLGGLRHAHRIRSTGVA